MAAVPGAAREPGRAAGIVLAGTLVEVWHLLAAAAALGTAAAVALLLGRIRRRAGAGPEKWGNTALRGFMPPRLRY